MLDGCVGFSLVDYVVVLWWLVCAFFFMLFLICTSSAGAKLSFPERRRHGAAALVAGSAATVSRRRRLLNATAKSLGNTLLELLKVDRVRRERHGYRLQDGAPHVEGASEHRIHPAAQLAAHVVRVTRLPRRSIEVDRVNARAKVVVSGGPRGD